MARRVNPAAGQTATEEIDEVVPVHGGASGVEPDPLAVKPFVPERSEVVEEARAAIPPAKRYRVLKEASLVYANSRTTLKAGKEISEAAYDIDLIRKQGIQLEEIV